MALQVRVQCVPEPAMATSTIWHAVVRSEERGWVLHDPDMPLCPYLSSRHMSPRTRYTNAESDPSTTISSSSSGNNIDRDAVAPLSTILVAFREA